MRVCSHTRLYEWALSGVPCHAGFCARGPGFLSAPREQFRLKSCRRERPTMPRMSLLGRMHCALVCGGKGPE